MTLISISTTWMYFPEKKLVVDEYDGETLANDKTDVNIAILYW